MTPADVSRLADERFIALTTYRRNGAGVSTPVWVIGDGPDLLVSTPVGTGKVKRLRHDARVSMQPCTRRGQVEPGAPTVDGVGEVSRDPAEAARPSGLLKAKYGAEYRIFMVVEWLARRGHSAARQVIRISPAPASPTP